MKTTKAHFKLFDKHVSKWAEVFKLSAQWKIFTSHVELNDQDSLAETTCDYPAKTATMFLNKIWANTEVTERELDETAFHEILEIILDKMDSMAKLSCIGDVVDTARHGVIQTFTSTIFDPLYQEKEKD